MDNYLNVLTGNVGRLRLVVSMKQRFWQQQRLQRSKKHNEEVGPSGLSSKSRALWKLYRPTTANLGAAVPRI